MYASKSKRFTLIEIIMVLVILGILAAVAVPKYISMADDADRAVCIGATSELNAQVLQSWGKARISGSQELYGAYTGDLGEDFVVTGQKPGEPASGTIKRADGAATYTLTWTAGGDGGPGRFRLD